MSKRDQRSRLSAGSTLVGLGAASVADRIWHTMPLEYGAGLLALGLAVLVWYAVPVARKERVR